MKRKPKLEPGNEQDDSLDFIVGVGSFDSFTAVPKDDKPKVKRQIGFIQQKTKCDQRPKRVKTTK